MSETDRYVVVSLSGYPVPVQQHIYETGRFGTDWIVLDRYRGYLEIDMFSGALGRLKAMRFAWGLNREERRWEREQ